MSHDVNDTADSIDWVKESAEFLNFIWSPFKKGFTFIRTIDVQTGVRSEHSFSADVSTHELVNFFQKHPREQYEMFFCPNAFKKNRRRLSEALPTPYAWAVVDRLEMDIFPDPYFMWDSAPEVCHAIWPFDRKISARRAEDISREIAFTFGLKMDAWRATKYLRIPLTLNNKHYVRMRNTASYNIKSNQPVPEPIADEFKYLFRYACSGREDELIETTIPDGWSHVELVYYKYFKKLSNYALSGMRHRSLYFRDRQWMIDGILHELISAGATRQEIRTVLWNNVYFLAEFGRDRTVLDEEISRKARKMKKDQS